MKNNEKSARIRYLRKLEKFANQALVLLKKENFNEELFKQRMLKNKNIFKEDEIIRLDSSYSKELLGFVNLCLDFTKTHDFLLQKANELDKMRKTCYKKDKHKNKFKENYDNSNL